MANKRLKVKNKPKEATEIAKQRRHERGTRIKVVNKITAQQFEDMHRFCINPNDVRVDIQRCVREAKKQGKEPYLPRNIKAVCDYPNMGYCFHGLPSPEVLKEINDKLGFKVPLPEEDSNDLVGVSENDATPVHTQVIGKYKIQIGGK